MIAIYILSSITLIIVCILSFVTLFPPLFYILIPVSSILLYLVLQKYNITFPNNLYISLLYFTIFTLIFVLFINKGVHYKENYNKLEKYTPNFSQFSTESPPPSIEGKDIDTSYVLPFTFVKDSEEFNIYKPFSVTLDKEGINTDDINEGTSIYIRFKDNTSPKPKIQFHFQVTKKDTKNNNKYYLSYIPASPGIDMKRFIEEYEGLLSEIEDSKDSKTFTDLTASMEDGSGDSEYGIANIKLKINKYTDSCPNQSQFIPINESDAEFCDSLNLYQKFLVYCNKELDKSPMTTTKSEEDCGRRHLFLKHFLFGNMTMNAYSNDNKKIDLKDLVYDIGIDIYDGKGKEVKMNDVHHIFGVKQKNTNCVQHVIPILNPHSRLPTNCLYQTTFDQN